MVDMGFFEYVFVYEFGYYFVGLVDEYYTLDVVYEIGVVYYFEFWEFNIIVLHDFDIFKWGDFV